MTLQNTLEAQRPPSVDEFRRYTYCITKQIVDTPLKLRALAGIAMKSYHAAINDDRVRSAFVREWLASHSSGNLAGYRENVERASYLGSFVFMNEKDEDIQNLNRQ